MLLNILSKSNPGHTLLVFVLLNAESHGLRRIEPEPYDCECGNILTPFELDLGDRRKQSWPDCKSWRDDGQKRCPECGERVSTDKQQHAHALGYESFDQDEYDDITDEARQTAFDKTDGTCIACGQPAEAIHRIVPPMFGGSGDPVNLAPVCSDHRHQTGHRFVDVLAPWEWENFSELDWEEYVTELRDDYSESDSDAAERIVELCEGLLEDERPPNPRPYADSNLGEPIEADVSIDSSADTRVAVKEVIEQTSEEYSDDAGISERVVRFVVREQCEVGKGEVESTIESLLNRGELYRPSENRLKAV